MIRKSDFLFLKLFRNPYNFFLPPFFFKCFDLMHFWKSFDVVVFYTLKCYFEFVVVNVYLEERLLWFWDYKSYFTHRFIMFGYIIIWVMVKFCLANLEFGLWKNMFYMHAITKLKKIPHNEIQNYFQNMFHFYDSLYGLWVKGLYWCSLWGHLPWKKND